MLDAVNPVAAVLADAPRSASAPTVVYWPCAAAPHSRSMAPAAVGASVRSLAPGWDHAHLCLLDGQALLRADWDATYLQAGQVLHFVDAGVFPADNNTLRTAAFIALAVYAGPSAAFIAGSSSGFLYSAAYAGVLIAGSMAIDAALPVPPPNSPADAGSVSPTYSLSAQGNSARLGNAIPEHFGRIRAFLDYAAQPYAEASGNDQYLFQLYCVGEGSYDIEAMQIGDNLLSGYADVQSEVIAPGGALTLFPAAVITSTDVSGADLATNTAVGPYAVGPVSGTVNYLGADLLWPGGLGKFDNDGNLGGLSTTVLFEARLLTPAGVPNGAWFSLESVSFSAATITPQRRTYRWAVSGANYQVRATRTDQQDGSNRARHAVQWAGLRAYVQATNTFGDRTLIAVRMRATNQLSNAASRQFNVIATRKLPIWNGSTWSARTATRNPAWAFAYVCKTLGLSDGQIDLAALLTLSATWATRGDTFDGRFDSFVSSWEALQKIAYVGRARPYVQGGIVRIVRDQAAAVPVQVFTRHHMTPGSFATDSIMWSDDSPDYVQAKFFDQETWAWTTINVGLPGSAYARSDKITFFGIVNAAQAWKESIYRAACNQYRRRMVSFGVEREGLIPSLLDPVQVVHDVVGWGQAAEVIAWDAGSKILTLSEPLTWQTGATHYMLLRGQNGAPAGPYVVTGVAGNDDLMNFVIQSDNGWDDIFNTPEAWPDINSPPLIENQAQLAVTPAITPYTGGDAERTKAAFGWADTYATRCLVLGSTRDDGSKGKLQLVVDDPRVHTAETGGSPTPPVTSQLPVQATAPVLINLSVQPVPFDNSRWTATWSPTPWADGYEVEQSPDQVTWTAAIALTLTSVTLPNLYGALTHVRARALGITPGPWAYATVTFEPPAPFDIFDVGTQADGTRLYTFAYHSLPPSDWVGAELRYLSGSAAAPAWDSMQSLASDTSYLTNSPAELNFPTNAGTYTFAVRSLDSAGLLSSPVYRVATLPPRRAGGALVDRDERALGWPGVLTGCHISNGDIWANDTLTYAQMAAANMTFAQWTRWIMNPVSPIYYETTLVDLGSNIAGTVTYSLGTDGAPVVELATSSNGSTWSAWATTMTFSSRHVKLRLTLAATTEEPVPIVRQFNWFIT